MPREGLVHMGESSLTQVPYRRHVVVLVQHCEIASEELVAVPVWIVGEHSLGSQLPCAEGTRHLALEAACNEVDACCAVVS